MDAHPAIAQSAVVAQGINPEERRLVAYFVYSNGARFAVNQLRDFLGSRLPDYMVPATFARLETLPLTANGKVDRTALPPATENNILRDEIFTAPTTDIERGVAGILAPLLGINEVDVSANFFSVAFEWGAHFCFGAPLTRIEGQIVFEEIIRHFPTWSLEPGPLVWRTNLGLRGLTALPLSFSTGG